MNKYIVYIKADSEGRVVAVNSSAFLKEVEGWLAVDSGYGDSFHHAQGNYLPEPLMDDRGVYRYKMDGSVIVERTREEMDGDYTQPEKAPSYDDRIRALESAFERINVIINKIGVK